MEISYLLDESNGVRDPRGLMTCVSPRGGGESFVGFRFGVFFSFDLFAVRCTPRLRFHFCVFFSSSKRLYMYKKTRVHSCNERPKDLLNSNNNNCHSQLSPPPLDLSLIHYLSLYGRLPFPNYVHYNMLRINTAERTIRHCMAPV